MERDTLSLTWDLICEILSSMELVICVSISPSPNVPNLCVFNRKIWHMKRSSFDRLPRFFFSFFLVLSVDESVLSHCQLSLFCYGDKSAVTLDWASRGEKELDQDQQNSLEFFISFRCLFSCLIAICHSFISDLNYHNSLNAWQYPTLGCGSSSLATKLNVGLRHYGKGLIYYRPIF